MASMKSLCNPAMVQTWLVIECSRKPWTIPARGVYLFIYPNII